MCVLALFKVSRTIFLENTHAFIQSCHLAQKPKFSSWHILQNASWIGAGQNFGNFKQNKHWAIYKKEKQVGSNRVNT